jgi:hypothetical protein
VGDDVNLPVGRPIGELNEKLLEQRHRRFVALLVRHVVPARRGGCPAVQNRRTVECEIVRELRRLEHRRVERHVETVDEHQHAIV